MNDVVIYGKGDFAKLVLYYLNTSLDFNVVAFCADTIFCDSDNYCELPLVSFEEVEYEFPPKKYKMLVAVGYSKMRNRKNMYENAKKKGYQLINYIHPSVVSHGSIFGENNIILAGCVIEPNVRIGNNNVIWSMTLLGHDSVIGCHNYIAAKCLIAGNVTINDLSFIGNGVSMINGLNIESETYLIVGSTLRISTVMQGVYFGNPARLLKINKNGIEIK